MYTGQTINENSPFKLTQKGGFSSFGPVAVFYPDGTPFYVFPRKEAVNFNLPPGNYKTGQGTVLKKLSRPLEYNFPTRRTRERFMKLPSAVQVVFGENPNKASIFLDKAIVLIDNQFKNADPFTLDFILYHEIGHYYYKTEEFCDEYAQERMLQKGYNLSQVRHASFNALHPENPRNHLCSTKLQKATRKK